MSKSHMGNADGFQKGAAPANKGLPSPFRGKLHPNSPLTEEDVAFILASPLSGAELADRYGVGRKTIYRVRDSQVLAHLGPDPTGPQPDRRSRPASRALTEADIDAILAVFEPMNVASVADHADVIPGAKEMLADLKRQGIRIGSTTGYTRKIMAALMPIAAAEGYVPEITVCAGDLPEGRPSPLMMWYAMARMGIWPAADVVKVDDTPPGIGEGRNAGTWTVGLALTGNIAGLSAAELADLSEDDRGALRATATKEMERAGAHFIIDSVAQLPEALRYFNARLARGETPAS